MVLGEHSGHSNGEMLRLNVRSSRTENRNMRMGVYQMDSWSDIGEYPCYSFRASLVGDSNHNFSLLLHNPKLTPSWFMIQFPHSPDCVYGFVVAILFTHVIIFIKQTWHSFTSEVIVHANMFPKL